MASPVLTSIHPVNILSFGPTARPIDLRALNILIGPNGSGKSNVIEIIRLLHFLPDKDPWQVVLATGGVTEWVWKGAKTRQTHSSLSIRIHLAREHSVEVGEVEDISYSIELERYDSSFRVKHESMEICDNQGKLDSSENTFERVGARGEIHYRSLLAQDHKSFNLNAERSILSQLASPSVQASGIGADLPELFEVSEFLESLDFHQDWEFGADCPPREPRPVGQAVARLEENGYNLAQMLAHYRDNYKPVFEQLTMLAGKFYEPVKSIEVRLISTHLDIAIGEAGGYSTPAARLSDGMLRWLAILCILLNPNPAPVTCIDEPELGLHPDVIPTLADLLRDAATRTQLIVTTHSSALVDAFSEDPESVCVCERAEGGTSVRRLSQAGLATWLKDYSLGNLWTSGEIGGSRW